MKKSMQCIMTIAFIAFYLAAVDQTCAQQDITTTNISGDIIQWIQPNFPPYVITTGNNQGTGIDNLIANDMSKKLSDYTHTFREGNYQRILKEIKSKKHIVTTPLFKTAERQKFTIYSYVASYLVLPNGFIIRKEDKSKYLPYLSEEGRLDIEQLIANENISIGVNFGRSYSGILDEMIQKHKQSKKFVTKTSTDLSYPIIRLLNLKRIDAMFGFPVELQYVCDEEKIDCTKFEIIPVQGMVAYSPVYFGAPQSEWGEEVISKINTFLKEPGTVARYVSYYERWLDEQSKDTYKNVLREYYAEKYPSIYNTLPK